VPPIEGDAIAPELLCASLAHDAVTFHRIGGVTPPMAHRRQAVRTPQQRQLRTCNDAARACGGAEGLLSSPLACSVGDEDCRSRYSCLPEHIHDSLARTRAGAWPASLWRRRAYVLASLLGGCRNGSGRGRLQ